MLFAASCYDNPGCYDTAEFYDDLKRFKYLKRLIRSYLEDGDLKDRLILNHLIVLRNVFGAESTVRMVALRLEEYLPQLKPFLEFMGCLPDYIEMIGIEGRRIDTSRIPSDMFVMEAVELL